MSSPGWKNYSDLACSFPRVWRVVGAQLRPLEPLEHHAAYSTDGVSGGAFIGPPSRASQTAKVSFFFQSGLNIYIHTYIYMKYIFILLQIEEWMRKAKGKSRRVWGKRANVVPIRGFSTRIVTLFLYTQRYRFWFFSNQTEYPLVLQQSEKYNYDSNVGYFLENDLQQTSPLPSFPLKKNRW